MREEQRGRSRKRSRKRDRRREAGRRTVFAAVLLFLLCAAVSVIIFVPGAEAGAAGTFWKFFSAGEKSADGDGEQAEAPGEQILPGTGSGAGEAPAADAETLLVQRIPAGSAAEEKTEAAQPPKYTESEDTRLLAETGAETVTLLFAGDLLLDDRYAVMASLLERTGGKPDLTKAFDAELLETMRSADVFMLNNEFPYSSRGTALAEKQYTFRAKPACAALLEDIGTDLVALANNHMYDYGEEALLDTLDTLSSLTIASAQTPEKETAAGEAEAAEAGTVPAVSGTADQAALPESTGAETAGNSVTGLPHIGAGRTIREAAAPFYFTNGRIKIGFVSATQIERMGDPDTKGATETSAGVFRCLDPEKLESVIAEMKENCDFVVAYLHWGTESTETVDEHQKKLAAAVAAAGADLIIGDHPHVLQGIDTVGGVPVIYSLGNYLFNSKAQDTGLVRVELDAETAELKSFKFIPCRQENCCTKLLSGEEKERVLETMRRLSGVSIDEEGYAALPQ